MNIGGPQGMIHSLKVELEPGHPARSLQDSPLGLELLACFTEFIRVGLHSAPQFTPILINFRKSTQPVEALVV